MNTKLCCIIIYYQDEGPGDLSRKTNLVFASEIYKFMRNREKNLSLRWVKSSKGVTFVYGRRKSGHWDPRLAPVHSSVETECEVCMLND